MTDLAADTARTSTRGPIKTTGILHFTIGVRDHLAAATFYSELLGCRHLRSNERYSFMQCGTDYFVLAKIPQAVPIPRHLRAVPRWRLALAGR